MRQIVTLVLLAGLTATWLAAGAAPHRPVVNTPEALRHGRVGGPHGAGTGALS